MSRILLVEDEPAIAEAVSYALRDAGYDVDHTSDGSEALAAAREEHYDLMVLDLLLPGVPGLDVCRTLRAESDVPIVMLTARDAVGERRVGRLPRVGRRCAQPASRSGLRPSRRPRGLRRPRRR